ncbi:structural protein [Polaribacter phage Freya_1]|uniref:Structural protein n=1 Tax=Polaribacter phage Freya_1 TaxID=2745662 RepID=A0A8E4ZFX5_9CAUD|nr:structural protein [Polaribacter phage Freya_1]QQV90965.1 structural protein [Polaribacter phage Freya_2]QQV91033.1 structural protein [Polaribacter phage Freya_3]QQV91101.1 structural protein [Polaribacter phage Freya_4]QQV91176.1 structural protein [Polaribacter phage Freya_8]QQV91253.1 structural protein [Polaribacter phage Freya_9]QQV91331.1 structural protein [Polaribacter phage Freya_10]QYV99910.1 structural protein [Polaribacter phage Freya_5]QYV99980.1 structural protein [Polarib
MANPILYISKLNSISFAKREVSDYKTDENTLSHEGRQLLSSHAIQYFQPTDVEPIQVLSNLEDIKGEIYKDNVLQDTINAVLKIKHLDTNVTLDCEIVDLDESDNLGIKFTEGNIYTASDNLTIIGTYSLNGFLPDFTRTSTDIIGKTIEIDGEDCLVVGLVYDEVVEAWCIEIESTTITTGVNIMSITYDVEKYNVYEIDFDFSDYNNSDVFLLIKAENNTQTFYQVSERLKIGFQNRLIEIRHKGESDKDVFYSTGIKHLLRLKYIKIIPYTSQESENQKNDNDVYLIDSQVNEGNEFTLESVPFNIYRRIVLALSQSVLFIDSIRYIIDGEVNLEDNDESNLVDISFQVIKASSSIDNTEFEQFLNDETISNFVFDNEAFVLENDDYLIF